MVRVWLALGCVVAALPLVVRPEARGAKPAVAAPKKRPLVRLFVQDLATSSLRWGDVQETAEGYGLAPLQGVEGFAGLDPARQKLVQMSQAERMLCVGVRDEEEGAYKSGWMLVKSGVGYTDHGDHGHWSFKWKPRVVDSRLDTRQGNPAHLYLYGGKFFLANDRLNGYTRIDPKEYLEGKKGTPRFVPGGGNHITLAVVEDRVGYGAWIDGGGPNQGRVDVTPIHGKEPSAIAYSFRLPTGVIHGATANSGKVFFAPADGICWVEADREVKLRPEAVKVHHISLGKEGDKPRRTGAFANHGPYVLCVTGKQASAALVLLDARKSEPQPVLVPLTVAKGTQATTPHVAVTPAGKAYALVFHDRTKGSEAEEALEVVDLDPNGDGDCSDARSIKRLKVGTSAVEGHFGHHDLAFDADRRHGFFSNPGDGTVSMLDLKRLEVVATFKVGGKPTALTVVGGQDGED
ncbi:MAG: hypothetical protein U0840_12865 [Gemmataceae bacterium]